MATVSKKKPWFRWYRDTCSDVKFRFVRLIASEIEWPERADKEELVVTLSEVTATWALLLECVTDDNGSVTAPFNLVTYIDTVLDFGTKRAQSIITAMQECKLIERDKHDNIKVPNWQRRQHLDDTNAERQARHRITKRNAKRNGKVTPTETETYTETKTETETEKKKPRATRVPAGEFEEWYGAYPKHEGRGAALKAYNGARKKASHEVLLAGAKREAAKIFSDPKYIKQPASWLNAECWLDEPVKATRAMSDEERNAYRGVR
jgi:hypothetical protein